MQGEAAGVQALINAGLPKEIAYDQLSFVDDVNYVMSLIEQEQAGIPPLDADDGDTGQTGGDLIAQATSGQTLNGAQITALLSVIEQIKAGTLSRDSGIAIAVSGLGITEDAAKQIIK